MKIAKFLTVIAVAALFSFTSTAPLIAQDDPRGREIGPVSSPDLNSMFFSRDGSRLVISSRPGSSSIIHILDVASGTEVERFEERRAVVSDDGRLMVAFGPEGQLEIIEIATGTILHALAYGGANVGTRPMFVAGDTLILAGWRDSQAVLIDVESGSVVSQFQHTEEIDLYDPVGLSADGQWVVTGHSGVFLIWARDGSVPLRGVETGFGRSNGRLDGRGNLIAVAQEQDYTDVFPLDPAEPPRRIDLGRDDYSNITINRDGTLAVIRSRRTGAVVDLETETLLYNFGPRIGSEIKSVDFSPDGSMIAIGRAYGAAFLVDARTGAFRGLHVPHIETPVQAIAFSPDGGSIASASLRDMRIWPVATALASNPPIAALHCVDGNFTSYSEPALAGAEAGSIFLDRSRSLRLLRSETGIHESFMEDIEVDIAAFGLSRDQSTLIAVLGDGSVEIRSLETGAQVSVLGPHSYAVTEAVLSNDGARAMTLDEHGIAALWNTETGQTMVVINSDEHTISAIALNPHETTVAFAAGTGIWFSDTVEGESLTQFSMSSLGDTVDFVRFLPDSRALVANGAGDVLVFNWRTGARMALYNVDVEYDLSFLEVSPDGRSFVHDERNTAVLRDVETGNEIHRFAHDITIQDITYDPAGGRLLTSSGDATARLWSLETGDELGRFVGHRGIVEQIAFLPGNAGVVSAGADRQICIYDAPQN